MQRRSIAVCISSGGDSAGLQRLLGSLASVQIPSNWDLSVVIVDNTFEGDLSDRIPVAPGLGRVEMVREERRGIPFARNRSVSVALELGAAFVVFVDDDEVISPSWLEHLLATADDYGAAVVAGPVVPRFPEGAPRWPALTGLYERRRLPTGSPLTWAATHNTLVDTAVFRAVEPWFEPRFAETGGSDSEFFRRVGQAGFRMVWCDEAVVDEWVPLERLTPKWLIRRLLRLGSVAGSELARQHSGRRIRVILPAIRSVAVVAFGPLYILADLSKGWRALRRLRHLFYNAGLVMGIVGRVVREYAVADVDGTRE